MGFLPMLLTMIINALVALNRIQGFLMRSESALEQSVDEKGVTPGEVRISGKVHRVIKGSCPAMALMSCDGLFP